MGAILKPGTQRADDVSGYLPGFSDIYCLVMAKMRVLFFAESVIDVRNEQCMNEYSENL